VTVQKLVITSIIPETETNEGVSNVFRAADSKDVPGSGILNGLEIRIVNG